MKLISNHLIGVRRIGINILFQIFNVIFTFSNINSKNSDLINIYSLLYQTNSFRCTI
ncbi:hypothetical protein GLOIN_2v1556912 [Rhizophagus irregularis DAOM 181602=DAOM 197198]|uniref:Uncharacterized protein n=1 Tax=Rhizophagus irregularis (strain DAOM 181602 / DAOM 197198 / MUCL 43194) TaxID=747089 RepID=A0A2P4QFB1_RHIID|nr:hypothetical protein GLOIN_2v1556912 [Rhizophagus irregularis DAOM 181602=DAOM 197198]POG76310.1 hypothetical protein GLOIN_2v1556912 [Rhizophagus irregularis DAOM 181602=DAOM 197198]|eukprot:XP_025183176.1 hypothetical protein GLOIN_2v1556912 [Rhizophagus irregularis DAOM 181602=DAOM 197198]